MNPEKISVVIPTYTPNQELLKKTLFSLMHQSVRPIKVVVVENGVENADTKKTVEGFGFAYIFNESPGANLARNLGASICDDGVLLFTDDDCELKHDCLEQHLKIHSRGNFIVGGKVDLNYLVEKPEWLCCHFELMLAKLDWTPDHVLGDVDLDLTKERTKYLVSANLSIRTSSFNQHGGFNIKDGYNGKKLLAANDEMMLLENCRLSGDTKVIFSSRCVIKHNIPAERVTEEYMHRRFYGQGVADSKSAVGSPHLKLIEPTVDPTDYETIVTNTLLRHTVWSDHYQNAMKDALTGDKLIDREITRLYMMCYCEYIRGVQDFLLGEIS